MQHTEPTTTEHLPHYVYVHRLAGTTTEFYVGKGVGRRAWSKNGRNPTWHDTVAAHGYDVEIIARFATEKEALSYEIDRIWIYKLVEELANRTPGGEGGGCRLSDEERARRAAWEAAWVEARKARKAELAELERWENVLARMRAAEYAHMAEMLMHGREPTSYGERAARAYKLKAYRKLERVRERHYAECAKMAPEYGEPAAKAFTAQSQSCTEFWVVFTGGVRPRLPYCGRGIAQISFETLSEQRYRQTAAKKAARHAARRESNQAYWDQPGRREAARAAELARRAAGGRVNDTAAAAAAQLEAA